MNKNAIKVMMETKSICDIDFSVWSLTFEEDSK